MSDTVLVTVQGHPYEMDVSGGCTANLLMRSALKKHGIIDYLKTRNWEMCVNGYYVQDAQQVGALATGKIHVEHLPGWGG